MGSLIEALKDERMVRGPVAGVAKAVSFRLRLRQVFSKAALHVANCVNGIRVGYYRYIGLEEALGRAVKRGNLKAAERLLDAGANPNKMPNMVDGGWYAQPAMHEAVAAGNLQMLKLLLERGGYPDAINNVFQTPLMLLAKSRLPEETMRQLAKLLLDAGANPDAQDARGFSSLHSATATGNAAACEVLLARGAYPRMEDVEGRRPDMLIPAGTRPEIEKALKTALKEAPYSVKTQKTVRAAKPLVLKPASVKGL